MNRHLELSGLISSAVRNTISSCISKTNYSFTRMDRPIDPAIDRPAGQRSSDHLARFNYRIYTRFFSLVCPFCLPSRRIDAFKDFGPSACNLPEVMIQYIDVSLYVHTDVPTYVHPHIHTRAGRHPVHNRCNGNLLTPRAMRSALREVRTDVRGGLLAPTAGDGVCYLMHYFYRICTAIVKFHVNASPPVFGTYCKLAL